MARPAPARDEHRHLVLIVDDFRDTLNALAACLRVRGCDVRTAAGGIEALSQLRSGLRPCVMLLDIRMPDMDGWTVWDRMRAHRDLGRTPVVILSVDLADHERARRLGIREFLRKPIDHERLAMAVERHCESRHVTAAARRA